MQKYYKNMPHVKEKHDKFCSLHVNPSKVWFLKKKHISKKILKK